MERNAPDGFRRGRVVLLVDQRIYTAIPAAEVL